MMMLLTCAEYNPPHRYTHANSHLNESIWTTNRNSLSKKLSCNYMIFFRFLFLSGKICACMWRGGMFFFFIFIIPLKSPGEISKRRENGGNDAVLVRVNDRDKDLWSSFPMSFATVADHLTVSVTHIFHPVIIALKSPEPRTESTDPKIDLSNPVEWM